MKPRMSREKTRKGWPWLCILTLALSSAGCGTTGPQALSEADAAEREAAAEQRREVRARAIGKGAEAAARGALGTLGGALYGGLQGIGCGPLLAIICVPIGAVVGGVIGGVSAVASTPELGATLSAASDEPDASTSSDDAPRSSVAVASEVPPNAAHQPDAVGETIVEAESPTSSSDVTRPAALSSADPRPDESIAELAKEGLRQGDRWEYAYVDSRNGRPVSRKFEITQIDSTRLIERIELENGKIFTATHRGGAYLSMTGGMQFAPHYSALEANRFSGRLDRIKVVGGDPCEWAPKNFRNSNECEISAEFEGTETITVPAGTFEAQRVHVQVSQYVWGYSTDARSGVIADGRFWFVPKVGRLVSATVTYESERPWTETMELVSYRVHGQLAAMSESPHEEPR